VPRVDPPRRIGRPSSPRNLPAQTASIVGRMDKGCLSKIAWNRKSPSATPRESNGGFMRRPVRVVNVAAIPQGGFARPDAVLEQVRTPSGPGGGRCLQRGTIQHRNHSGTGWAGRFPFWGSHVARRSLIDSRGEMTRGILRGERCPWPRSLAIHSRM
jgi:hypothetical protein